MDPEFVRMAPGLEVVEEAYRALPLREYVRMGAPSSSLVEEAEAVAAYPSSTPRP